MKERSGSIPAYALKWSEKEFISILGVGIPIPHLWFVAHAKRIRSSVLNRRDSPVEESESNVPVLAVGYSGNASFFAFKPRLWDGCALRFLGWAVSRSRNNKGAVLAKESYNRSIKDGKLHLYCFWYERSCSNCNCLLSVAVNVPVRSFLRYAISWKK